MKKTLCFCTIVIDSIPAESPLSKQCANCKHSIDCHRPSTSLDKLIINTLTGRVGLQCRLQMDKDDKQMTPISINDSDDAGIGAWFEPTNIDPDDDDGIVSVNRFICSGVGCSCAPHVNHS